MEAEQVRLLKKFEDWVTIEKVSVNSITLDELII